MGNNIDTVNKFASIKCCLLFLSITMLSIIRYMFMLIKKQMHKVGVYFSTNPVLDLKLEEMIWLGISAYIWVLKKKQTKYKDLLSILRRKISAYGNMMDASDSLKYAVDDSHSAVFQSIRF